MKGLDEVEKRAQGLLCDCGTSINLGIIVYSYYGTNFALYTKCWVVKKDVHKMRQLK